MSVDNSCADGAPSESNTPGWVKTTATIAGVMAFAGGYVALRTVDTDTTDTARGCNASRLSELVYRDDDSTRVVDLRHKLIRADGIVKSETLGLRVGDVSLQNANLSDGRPVAVVRVKFHDGGIMKFWTNRDVTNADSGHLGPRSSDPSAIDLSRIAKLVDANANETNSSCVDLTTDSR